MKTINLSNLITAMTDKCDEMMAGLEANFTKDMFVKA